MPAPVDTRATRTTRTTAPTWSDRPALPDRALREALHEALAQQAVADAHGHPLLRAEALTETARCLAALHAFAASQACLELALQAARRLPANHDQQADLLCALAEVCCNAADLAEASSADAAPRRPDPDRARAHAWAAAAADAAAQASDPHWQVQVLLRAADVLERGGAEEEATALHRQALALQSPDKPSRWARSAPGLRHAAPRQAM